MRKDLLLSLAGMALLGLSPALAQTTPAAPAAPATVAPPTPEPEFPALPAYHGQPLTPQTVQTPDKKPLQSGSIPQANPAPAGSLPSVAAPNGQSISPPISTVPKAVQAPQPSVLPLSPTATPPAFSAYVPYGIPDEDIAPDHDGSSYISLDSWVYPAIVHLYELGYVDTMFLGLQPYTRRSVMHMLRESGDAIMQSDDEEAQDILAGLLRELSAEKPNNLQDRGLVYGVHQVYERAMYINGTPLRDSFHIGQTINNDYGRPYQSGFNNIVGASYLGELGRLSLFVRGEYQHSPSAAGYSDTLANAFSILDQSPIIPDNMNVPTIPRGPIVAQNPFRLVEATLSFHVLGHEISGGKSDAWIGPSKGAAFAWTDNAENIYSFRINRVEPLIIPFLSKVLGPMRYDFFYGSLKGHSDPNHPYVHAEMFAFRPTVNFEFGFERTVIFGGAGHEPVNLHSFLRSVFDFDDVQGDVKHSTKDPGARFSTFNVSYRLPFVRKYATFYVDSMSHDDVSPISAPRRADIRTGIDLSQIPHLRKMEVRAEGVLTDPRVTPSFAGQFAYYETIQHQGYTNKGYIMGDSIGREGKGGQAWFTYHTAANQYYELEYLRKKNAKDFIGYGTTQDQVKFSVVKRIKTDYELNAWVQYERWTAPIYLSGKRNDTTVAVQLSYYPHLHTNDR